MAVAVISDLHLGLGDASDVFGHEDERFLRFLSALEGSFERIVLLGDVWETLTARGPIGPAEGLRRAREAHPGIARRFERPEYLYVHGNHDLVARDVDRAPEELVLTLGGARILFTHGHLQDPLVRHARWVSETGVYLGGLLLRAGLGGVQRLFASADRLREGVAADAASCPFQRWAVDRARGHQADVVVTGHTHRAARAEHDAALFLNSGSCAGGQFSFLALDPARGEFAVHREP